MQLVELELYGPFRGLQKGFKINFTRPLTQFNKVEPLCLVGLNGSGKSNIMQALSHIFFYLESNYNNGMRLRAPFYFRLHYRMPVTYNNFLTGIDPDTYRQNTSNAIVRDVIITKKRRANPVFEYFYTTFETIQQLTAKELIHKLLPGRVIGYSSGMNEFLSSPFYKMDHAYSNILNQKMEELLMQEQDEKEAEEEWAQDKSQKKKRKQQSGTKEKDYTALPDMNRLFYLDYQSNTMVLLSNYLMRKIADQQDRSEIDVINDITGIDDLYSFHISINLRVLQHHTADSIIAMLDIDGIIDKETDQRIYMNELVEDLFIPSRNINETMNLGKDIENLVLCSTTCKIKEAESLNENAEGKKVISLDLHFKVDEEMKRSFQTFFPGGPRRLFCSLYWLNLLNMNTYLGSTGKKIIRTDNDLNAHDLTVKTPASERIFNIDGIRFKKKGGQTISYRQFSDGEHQYLQIAGSLLLMDENTSLFLLDEPETHFNPEWRSKLISTLNEIMELKIAKDPDHFVPQQEIMLTTHSPFVVSDCQKENVYIFERDKEKGVQFRKPKINTYGTSVNILMNELFKSDDTIANVSKKEIEELKVEIKDAGSTADLEAIKKKASHLGDSVEKFLMYYTLNTKQKELDDPGADNSQLSMTDEEPVPA